MKTEKGCWCDNCKRRVKEDSLKRFETTEGIKFLCWRCELKLNNKTYGKAKI